MPLRPNSSMRKTRKALHGWKQDGAFYLSLAPKTEKMAFNQYASSQEALSEASKRHLPIVWEDPSVID